MTREEAIKVIRKMLAYTDLSVRANLTADMVDACHLAIKALEQEHSDKQRYVVRGINNDKIEFIDKYSVRAFNRYIKFIKASCRYEVLDKIRAEIERKLNAHGTVSLYNKAINDVLEILDKYKAESEK